MFNVSVIFRYVLHHLFETKLLRTFDILVAGYWPPFLHFIGLLEMRWKYTLNGTPVHCHTVIYVKGHLG